MDLQLQDKRALITGSTSRIGKAIAQTLATEGVIVVLQGRRETEAKRVADAIMVAGGKASTADLKTSIESARASAQSLFEYLGRQYLWIMQLGKAKLKHIANERHPHIKPVSFREVIGMLSSS